MFFHDDFYSFNVELPHAMEKWAAAASVIRAAGSAGAKALRNANVRAARPLSGAKGALPTKKIDPNMFGVGQSQLPPVNLTPYNANHVRMRNVMNAGRRALLPAAGAGAGAYLAGL